MRLLMMKNELTTAIIVLENEIRNYERILNMGIAAHNVVTSLSKENWIKSKTDLEQVVTLLKSFIEED